MKPSIETRQFELKQAGWRDVADLQRLEKICFKQDAWPLIDLVGVLTLPGPVRIKAIIGDEMVGFISGERRSNGECWITTICVLPAHRQKGIASALMRACEEALGNNVVRLCVRVENQPAIHLYEKLGYRRVEIWKNYYSGQGDALVMEKRRT